MNKIRLANARKFWQVTTLSLAIMGGYSQSVWAQDYDLMSIYEMAKTHDAKIAQAMAKYEADKQVVDLVKAPLLPQISAQASYATTNSSADFSDSTSTSAAIILKQSLYQHDVWARFKQSKNQHKTAEYALRTAEQDLILRVAETYFKVLLASEDVTLTKALESANKTQWERAIASAEVGLASRTDVLQAKSSYDIALSDRLNAESGYDSALEELMQLTGSSIETLKSMRLDVNLPLTDLSIQDWEQKALAQNLTVLTIAEQASIANQEVDVQKGGYWPQVNFQASYTDSKYKKNELNAFNRSRQDVSFSITASVPLYSGGATQIQVSQARANYKAANMGLRDSQEQARLAVRVLVRNIQKGMERIYALRAAVKSSDAFLEAAEEGYKVGLKSLLEVLTAQANRFKAHRDLASAIQTNIVNQLKLELTVGELDVADIEQFNQLLGQ